MMPRSLSAFTLPLPPGCKLAIEILRCDLRNLVSAPAAAWSLVAGISAQICLARAVMSTQRYSCMQSTVSAVSKKSPQLPATSTVLTPRSE